MKTKWEYIVQYYSRYELQAVLDERGEEGWELIHLEPLTASDIDDPYPYFAVFQRELEEEVEDDESTAWYHQP